MIFRYATIEEAKKAVVLWNGKPESVVHIEDFSSSVFKFVSDSNTPRILRFIDNNQRSYDEVLGELEFLEHLKLNAVRSCYPELSRDGFLAVPFEAVSGLLTCCSLNFVPGIELTETSPYWGKELFRKWGKNLASIHRASRTFSPQKMRRWQWNDEHLIRKFDLLIPKNDVQSQVLFQEIIAGCNALQKTSNNFGLIHGDHAPNNFIFDSDTEELTAIDFGNCCYHWYLADIAIALSVVKRNKNKEEIKSEILAGYCETESLPKDFEDIINLFLKLRVMYVYLDRLHRFGPNPTSQETELLKTLKERVHSINGW